MVKVNSPNKKQSPQKHEQEKQILIDQGNHQKEEGNLLEPLKQEDSKDSPDKNDKKLYLNLSSLNEINSQNEGDFDNNIQGRNNSNSSSQFYFNGQKPSYNQYNNNYFSLDQQTKNELNNAERKLAKRSFDQIWKKNEKYTKEQYKFEYVLQKLLDQLELEIYMKAGEKINQKYRDNVDKVKKNLNLLLKFPEVSSLFLLEKVSISKLRVKTEKFRKTCITLERKKRENMKKAELGTQDSDQTYESLNGSANFSDIEENAEDMTDLVMSYQNKSGHQFLCPYNPTEEYKLWKRYQVKPKPIFYDPAEGETPPEKNTAPRGSILQVWEGKIKFSRILDPIKGQLQSSKDIKMFQCLQKWQQTFNISGKASSIEVMKYFLSNSKPQYFISGVIKYDEEDLEQVTLYNELYNSMKQDDKFSVIKPYQDNSLTLYLFPYLPENEKHFQVVRHLGISEELFDDSKLQIMFAGFIKQKMSLSRNFINPIVIKVKNYIQTADSIEQIKKKQQQKKHQKSNKDSNNPLDMNNFSPISTDQSDNEVQETKTSSIKKQDNSTIEEKSQINTIDNDPDVKEMRDLLQIADQGHYSPEQLLKVIQDKLKQTNMIERVNTYDEVKKQTLQDILQKLINYTQPKPQQLPIQGSSAQSQNNISESQKAQMMYSNQNGQQMQLQQSVSYQQQIQLPQYNRVQAYYNAVPALRPPPAALGQSILLNQNQSYQIMNPQQYNIQGYQNQQLAVQQQIQLQQQSMQQFQNQQFMMNQQQMMPMIRPPPIGLSPNLPHSSANNLLQQQRSAMMHSSYSYNTQNHK
ncbi:UNKNOWN [Stylonychia lemnae]|uniref:Uncharacterized protein n=1 Tax=Stylonychia lemnae TaxID=5949 RepID=A0A078AAB0_STYLE|nr:UNKNOWN [Stylonychia lemnae]|eukprot:CDW79195.1 UNKNOWN [Stylonychia lemnae]